MRDILTEVAGEGARAEDPAETARRLSKQALPKRFYSAVSVDEEGGACRVLLDGKPVRTPARNVLAVSRPAVAEALAEEWRAQGEHIDPATMPLTRLVNSALDGVANEIAAVADETAHYAGSDLLYYRADGPDRLVERQTATWDPILVWAERRFGVRFRLASGVMPVEQDPAVVGSIRAAMPEDAVLLAGLNTATSLLGSVLLALAVLEGAVSEEAAWNAAHLDEDWNAELWAKTTKPPPGAPTAGARWRPRASPCGADRLQRIFPAVCWRRNAFALSWSMEERRF